MAKISGSHRTGGVLSRVAAAAIAAALVATGAGVAVADGPQHTATGAAQAARAAQAASAPAPAVERSAARGEYRNLHGLTGPTLYDYIPDGRGGYVTRGWVTDQWRDVKNATQADNDRDGVADDFYVWFTDGHLAYLSEEGEYVQLGGGWNAYDKAYSPGDLGGAAGSDIIARDSGGTLWIYLGYGDGRLTGRTEIGGGWQVYSQIAGVGDLSGDGRNDIVARDGSGVLWLYKGTGDYKAPFEPRTEIGGGWNLFNTLVGVGDLDFDGVNDLVARDTAGALWRYSGTGNAAAPFEPRVKIGSSGWNAYRVIF
ncbi:FG-GAP repeat domain-containing protein [Streptomyces genisteinicus]|uniref:VCBS repeat-containing protein n=1 Tax=Streptomyces genisteinicus TaxID=2768068 RepID=A0A7H0HZP5_9ACTN|nr:VCBS repeat-containing protein [Streptomyces genisteinicus]QNP66011.1 VCBS repeat-containing protein [Streptomyces genisteinicus]